jgi:hypothetical protein
MLSLLQALKPFAQSLQPRRCVILQGRRQTLRRELKGRQLGITAIALRRRPSGETEGADGEGGRVRFAG